jgi:hypothetical protein
MWLEWITSQLEMIRQGKLDLCAGETGEDWPAMGWAEQSHTDFVSARIIVNDMMRNS